MKKILVVDDSAMMRLYYREVLQEAGFLVEEAVNGLEGLEKALHEAYDLLLVDVNMPHMDGYRMVRTLRQEESNRSVPVIIISTESQPGDIEQAYLAGANFYRVKPVPPAELKAMARLLSGVGAA